MIKSMTGYGSASINNNELTIFVEVKSLNSKSFDLYLKTPKNFFDKENEIRHLVSKQLERGKISLTVEIEHKTEQKQKVSFNKEVIKSYYKQIKEIAGELGCDNGDILRMAFSMPDTYLQNISEQGNEEENKIFFELLEQALEACMQFRIHEGEILKQKLNEYITTIRVALSKIELLDPQRIEKVRAKIQKQISDLLQSDQFDKNRFEQEIIYYIEKLDIKEEIVRLTKHLDYFNECLTSSEGNGKKLGFIAQEIGREINTIGSKANDAEIQRLVIEMKEELEKIKEQSLNIL
ncbi:MAG: YicC/YloC family endoribonuclease [Cytophagales bacterium]